jgi:hypothetical protein
MTPAEVKFALDAKLLSLARGGRVPVIASVHSAVLENNVVYVMYDIAGDDGPLLFEFERPEAVGADEVHDFYIWLALEEFRTLH